MHGNIEQLATPTPEQRFCAVAGILAGAVPRLRARAALPPSAEELSAPRILLENAANPLDVTPETRLSVPPG